MSTNSECEIVGLDNGQWFWVLEDYNAPKNAWDWREYASCGGPYSTADRAHADMLRGRANPGGHGKTEMTVGQAMADKVLRELIEGALGKALVPTPLPATPRDVSKYLLLEPGHGIGYKPALKGVSDKALQDILQAFDEAMQPEDVDAGEPLATEAFRVPAGARPLLFGKTGSIQDLRGAMALSASRGPEGITVTMHDFWVLPEVRDGSIVPEAATFAAKEIKRRASEAYPGDPVNFVSLTETPGSKKMAEVMREVLVGPRPEEDTPSPM